MGALDKIELIMNITLNISSRRGGKIPGDPEEAGSDFPYGGS